MFQSLSKLLKRSSEIIAKLIYPKYFCMKIVHYKKALSVALGTTLAVLHVQRCTAGLASLLAFQVIFTKHLIDDGFNIEMFRSVPKSLIRSI